MGGRSKEEMKHMIKREDIGKAMNFGKYPVLYIDLANQPQWVKLADKESDYCTGQDVKVAWDLEGGRHAGMTTRGHLYRENGKFYISQNCTCLHDSFGRGDILEDLHWANVTTVHKGQTVILVVDNTEENACAVVVMKVSEKIDIHCSTVCQLEEVEEDFKV